MKRCFPLRLETTQEYTLSPYLFNIIGEVLDNEIRKKKKRAHGLESFWGNRNAHLYI